MDIKELLEQNELHMEQVLKCPLDELQFSQHALRTLKSRGIYTLKDLTAKTRKELLAIPFLGKNAVCEIEDVLGNYDLKLKETTIC